MKPASDPVRKTFAPTERKCVFFPRWRAHQTKSCHYSARDLDRELLLLIPPSTALPLAIHVSGKLQRLDRMSTSASFNDASKKETEAAFAPDSAKSSNELISPFQETTGGIGATHRLLKTRHSKPYPSLLLPTATGELS